MYEVDQNTQDLCCKNQMKERALMAWKRKKLGGTGFEALLYQFFSSFYKNLSNSIRKHLLCTHFLCMSCSCRCSGSAELCVKHAEGQGRWWDGGSGDYCHSFSCDKIIFQSTICQYQVGDAGKGYILYYKHTLFMPTPSQSREIRA